MIPKYTGRPTPKDLPALFIAVISFSNSQLLPNPTVNKEY